MKQRLSKLQSTILMTVADKENSCYFNDIDMLKYCVKKNVLGDMGRYVGGVSEEQSHSFDVVFSNSIRNLKKKGFVRFTWKSQNSRKSRIKKIYLTDEALKLIIVINNKGRNNEI